MSLGFRVGALRGPELEGEVKIVADKKVTPKPAARSTAARSTGAATRVTKVSLKKKKKR